MRGVLQVVLGALLALALVVPVVRAATQADVCDPAGADGCPLGFNVNLRGLLKQATDVHTYRLDVPGPGRFLVTASPVSRPDADLVLGVLDPDGDPVLLAGASQPGDVPGFQASRPGEYRVLVRLSPSVDPRILAVPYFLNSYPSAAIGRLLPSAHAADGRAVTWHLAQALSVGWSADSGRVISSALGSPIQASRVADGGDADADGAASLLAVSPSAGLLALAAGETVQIRGLDDWQPKLALGPVDRPGSPIDRQIGSLTISRDGSTVAARAFDGLVAVWRLSDGGLVGTFGEAAGGSGSQVNGVALSGDGGRLAAIARGGVRVWDLAAHAELMRADQEPGTAPPQSVALDDDGQILATGLASGLLRLRSLEDGATRELAGHTGAVASLAFSADGALLVSGAALGSDRSDGSVRVWRTSDGSPAGTLAYPGQTAVMSLAFAPDGQHLAGALLDGTVRVWNAPHL